MWSFFIICLSLLDFRVIDLISYSDFAFAIQIVVFARRALQSHTGLLPGNFNFILT